MALRVSTTGSDIEITDLGIVVTHPTADRDLALEFTAIELKESTDLTEAIQNGDLDVDDGTNFIHQDDYDPDEFLIQELGYNRDELYISHDELASKNDILIVSGIFPIDLNSTASATRNIYAPSARFITWQLDANDIVEISGNTASGVYTVEEVTDQQNFIVAESISNSTGGAVNIYHPGGASKVGVDSSDLIYSDSGNLQDVLEDLDNGILAAGTQRVSWTAFPHFNGEIEMLGFNVLTDTDLTITSSSPQTVSEPGFHTHLVVNATSVSGTPFTLRISGTSIDEASGVLTPGATEDISITSTGYYQSTKSWITAPQLSIVESSKSITLDAYRMTYWDRGNNDFVITGCRLEFRPDSSTWSIRLVVYKVNDNGSLTVIDDVTMDDNDSPPRSGYSSSVGQMGKYKRTDYNTSVQGTSNEGLIVWLDQTNVENFYLEVSYSV